MPDLILLAEADGVATMVLNRPEKLNAFDDAMRAEFLAAIDALSARPDVRVLIITGAGRAFSAGGDVAYMVRLKQQDAAYEGGLGTLVAAGTTAISKITALPFPTVACVNGPAAGGGCNLALACDLRIAAREAKLGLPEARLGLVPGAGGTQRLTRIAGPAIAARVILTGEVLDGSAAEAAGLVQWAVARAELAGRAAAIATQVAALPGEALQACKSCIAATRDPARDGYAEELAQSRRLYASETTRRLVGAFLSGAAH